MFISLQRILKYGWQDFWRNRSVSASSIFVMVMMLSLITSLLLSQQAFKFLVLRLQEQVDISVYFREDSFEEDILEIKKELALIPEVKEVEYISKEKALENFIQLHQNDSRIMDSLTEVGGNPLLASLNIIAFEAAQYAQISGFLEKSSFAESIDKIDYHQRKPVIDRVFSISSEINTGGILFSFILALVAVSLIFNQVGLSIEHAKKEIEVMRLVGASDWFIRGPFLVQGVLIGFFATVLTLLIFLPLCFFLSAKIEILLPGLDIFGYFVNNFFTIFFIHLAFGIGLGMVSSWIAVRKYLA